MEKREPAEVPQPDDQDVTPPHGDRRHPDETVNRQRNMSRQSTPPAADPENDRPDE